MVNRNQYDELIVRYLGNELSAEEQKIIVEWIEADEDNKQHFEQLSRAWRLAAVKQTIESADVNREWNVFKQAVSDNKPVLQVVDDVYADQALFEHKKKAGVYRMIIRWTVAASVIALVVFGLDRLFDKKQNGSVAETSEGSTVAPVARLRHEVNASAVEKTLHLQDGSEIVLWAQSEVSFDEPFGNKRNIYLKGKADFKVAKDSTKPFTVISGDISTTALGTVFNVDAFESAVQIVVRLYEGKVVVKQANNIPGKLGNGVYLFPGQELVYDNRTLAYNIRPFETNRNSNNDGAESIAVTRGEGKDDPSIPKNEKGTWFMFNNESIENVFKQLEKMYNVEIDYSRKDVRKMYFIGKFDKADSVESILKQIGQPNGFKVRKEKNNKYVIY